MIYGCDRKKDCYDTEKTDPDFNHTDSRHYTDRMRQYAVIQLIWVRVEFPLQVGGAACRAVEIAEEGHGTEPVG